MTEAEWLACVVPQRLLDLVRDRGASRQLRLVACAIARNRWHLLVAPCSRNAVEVAEQFADNFCSVDDLLAAQERAAVVASVAVQREPQSLTTRAARLAVAATTEDAYTAAYLGTADVPNRQLSCAGSGSKFREVCVEQVHIYRDIFGNPFRPVTFFPSWLTPTSVAIATGIYDDRAFDRLPILADALQDAGCEDADILGHCRGDGPHVRGCWVIDGVLGKG
ncbi:SMI1/KNR4 family protein [Limnoglobus roseus]|uniref:SMI1/KNR4 family protein n=1 Tax=Limnoglobus roseus TaxID=2598579 RepID=A0A5C1AKN2_9BACT|nr:SMI1/KNR4 family protein [Limnoglobus roseus]